MNLYCICAFLEKGNFVVSFLTTLIGLGVDSSLTSKVPPEVELVSPKGALVVWEKENNKLL